MNFCVWRQRLKQRAQSTQQDYYYYYHQQTVEIGFSFIHCLRCVIEFIVIILILAFDCYHTPLRFRTPNQTKIKIKTKNARVKQKQL